MLKKVAFLFVFLTAIHSFAKVLEVGNCIGGASAQFATIQEAVNAATPGSRVLVCPGSYAEQVTINKPLTLRGAKLSSTSGATIIAPQGGVQANTSSLSSGNALAAQILVDSTWGVRISNLTVDGSNNGLTTCSSPIFIGIFFRNASGVVSHTAVVNQVLGSGDAGCQSGLAIFAQSGNGGSSKVEILNNTVHGYQKNGITGNEIGTWVNVANNTVVGVGPTTGAAENSIQVGFGAAGKIVGNTAMDDVWSPDVITDPGDAASGILVYASGSVLVRENIVANTQFGIALVTDVTGGPPADNNEVVENLVSASHVFDGIEVCSDHNVIRGNTINRSDESGIHLDSTCTNSDSSATGKGNRVKMNTIDSACTGILLGTSARANSIFGNDFFNVGSNSLNADQCVSPSPLVISHAVRMAGEQGRPSVRPAPARP